MSLRERNAAHTRKTILEKALELFADKGFESTTMEEVAAAAEIGTSTLYRYFPTKDGLVVEPLALRGQMAAELRARPTEEPLDLALGHALRALVATPRVEPAMLRQILAIIATAEGPRLRLLEDFARERDLLAQAIADRVDRPVDDLFCQMTARMTTDVLALRSHPQPARTSHDDDVAALDDLLAELRRHPPVLPA